MDDLPRALDVALLRELKCSECREYMVPPITLCTNGHSICSVCTVVDRCPTCRGSFSEIKKLTDLENDKPMQCKAVMNLKVGSTTNKMADNHPYCNFLKCPICLEYMKSPIEMCENGHNICANCRLHVSACPTCAGIFTNIRNFTLERIAATTTYPCKNREAGCTEMFTADDIHNHQSECLFQSKECPFRKLSDVDCSWTGLLSDIAAHVRSEHGSEAIEAEEIFKINLLNFSTERRDRLAVFISGDLFYLTWEIGHEAFRCAVYHFRHKNESEVSTFGIKIGSSEEYVAMRRKCHSYMQGGLNDLQPGKRVAINYGTIQEYFGESGDLSCKIEIRTNRLNVGFWRKWKKFCLLFLTLIFFFFLFFCVYGPVGISSGRTAALGLLC